MNRANESASGAHGNHVCEQSQSIVTVCLETRLAKVTCNAAGQIRLSILFNISVSLHWDPDIPDRIYHRIDRLGRGTLLLAAAL